MIHMPKGAKVLKDLFSHKEELKKVASSIKLSEECLAVIQRNLPKKGRSGDDHTTKLVQEQWVNTTIHDGKWIKQWVNTTIHNGKWINLEEEADPEEVRTISFYPKHEPLEPLECKAPKNREDQLLVVISYALSAHEKTKLLEVLKNHKGAIAWSIADIKVVHDQEFEEGARPTLQRT
nr:DNA-directed DNA polymerase [Tanacetum cinerariifolium]